MQANRQRILIALFLVAAAGVLVAFRWHAFSLPLETDEANYAYIAGRLLAGDALYVDVWDHQPPGIFLLFAAAIALAGDAPEVFRWLATGFSLISMLLLYVMVRRAASPPWSACAAMLFAIASSDPGTAGEGCNREIHMNTLILAGWYAALRAGDRRQPARVLWWVLVAGVAFAAASLIKTIVAIHWLAGAGWLAWQAGKEAGPSSQKARNMVSRLATFAVPPFVTWLAVFGYFTATNRLTEFTEAVFRFNLSYSQGGGSFAGRFVTFFTPGDKPYLQPFIFDSALPLWMASLVAIPIWIIALFARPMANGRDDRAAASLALLMLAASYVAVCLPAQFWPHYYHLLLPPALVVTVLALRMLSATVQAPVLRRAASVTLMALLAGALFVTQYRHYLAQPPFGITVSRYNGRDFWGRAQGENIRRVTQPDDQIFVYGADAAMYYYAQRKSASRYTMLTGLRSGYAGHEQRRATMLREIAERRPRLIVVVLGEESFPAWADFLPTRYDPVGWDFRDRPPHDPILMILCDRDRPVETIDWNWDRSAIGGWNLGEAR